MTSHSIGAALARLFALAICPWAAIVINAACPLSGLAANHAAGQHSLSKLDAANFSDYGMRALSQSKTQPTKDAPAKGDQEPEPPDVSKGDKAIAFKATTTNHAPIDFPAGYKGKLVLLDFWATWCGPCMIEMPELVKAYDQLHPQGLEILGISLDRPDSLDKLNKVTAEKGMKWPQIYDGGFWGATIVKLYGIKTIPMPILVDGDTGIIVAIGRELRGSQLEITLKRALASKTNSPKQ